MKQDYDLLVIGAGAAGSAAVWELMEQGKRVALVERDKLGGTCLNYGCDPTKTMLYSAHLLKQAQNGGDYGLRIEAAQVDWTALLKRVRAVQDQMRGGTPEEANAAMRRKGIDLFLGEARFVSAHEVAIGEQTVRAEHILITAGTETSVPPIEGLKETGYITNVEAVSLPKLPRRLAIIGGGPIGIEFAQLFRRFGVQITVLERGAHMLDTEDQELAKMLCHLLTEEGIVLKNNVDLKRVERTNEGKKLSIECGENKEEIIVDEILIAAGRKPSLEVLNLAVAGVETSEDGITVDATLRTNVPHIWAAGDVTGGYQFTHVASAQGSLVAHNIFAKQAKKFDDRVIPWGTYTYPTLAHVGKTEEELRKAKVKYRVGKISVKEIERAIADGQTEGLVKLLVDEKGQLLGGHILATGAEIMLAPIILAMRTGLPVSALAETLMPYPTMTEGVKQAAEKLLAD